MRIIIRLGTGAPAVFLPIIHHCLLVFSKPVARFIEQRGYQLSGRNDYSFLETALSILERDFNYKANFKLNEFFGPASASLKVSFAIDLASLVRSKHVSLTKRCTSARENNENAEVPPN